MNIYEFLSILFITGGNAAMILYRRIEGWEMAIFTVAQVIICMTIVGNSITREKNLLEKKP